MFYLASRGFVAIGFQSTLLKFSAKYIKARFQDFNCFTIKCDEKSFTSTDATIFI